jgi:membrane-bound serine protease (ClpP class)
MSTASLRRNPPGALAPAGVILLLLALGFLAAETQVPSGGVLGVAGIAALVAGILVLYDTDSEAFAVSVPAAIAAGVLLGAFTMFAASKGLAARRPSARGGPEELVGETGEARTPLDPVGQVFVHGALWRARSADPEATVAKGQPVEVKAVDGLTVTVGPTDGQPNQKEKHSR